MNAQYQQALLDAVEMLKTTDIEPTSALKQAGSDNGIPYGEEMGDFVRWAWGVLFKEERYS